jgi:formamidopyrimidine-DNA glycosylase
MPELPEVETYIRELAPLLAARAITGAAVHWPRTIDRPGVDEFIHRIVGQRFDAFGRRGKYMLFTLDSGDSLIVHLRMTGKLQLLPGIPIAGKHTHVVLNLDNESSLHFTDSRKFGRIYLVSDPIQVLHKLGPEPLHTEFTPSVLQKALQGRTAPIKALLLDQRVVAGIGNIYADEALYRARIHPQRAGGSLNEEEVTHLHAAIRFVLERGIECRGSSLGGSTLQNYSRPGGEQGGFQMEHQVFRRTGQPCTHCGQLITRIIVTQRSTHFCPACQPTP